MTDPFGVRLLILSADADLAVGVSRCLAPLARPDAVIAEPATMVRLSRCVGRTRGVPREWLVGDGRPLVDLLGSVCVPADDWLLVPVDYDAQVFVAERKSDLGAVRTIPVAEPDTLRRLNDKAWLAEFAPTAGIPTPRSVVLRSSELREPFALRFPVVAKPACGSAGRGIRRADTADALAAIVASVAPSHTAPVVVQELVEGDDVGVNVLADAGRVLAVTVQRHLRSRRLRFEAYDEAVDAACRLVAATGYTGVAHIDFIDPNGARSPLMLECNPRFWVSLPAACRAGANFAAMAVRLTLDGTVPTQTRPVLGECARIPWQDRLRDPLPYVYGRLRNLLDHVSGRTAVLQGAGHRGDASSPECATTALRSDLTSDRPADDR